MRRYTFRLEQVRRVRRMQEEMAKGELLAANKAVHDAQFALASAEAEYERAVSEPSIGLGLDAFRTRRYFDELAGRAVVAAQHVVAQQQEIAREKQAVWSQAASKVKVLDRLDERNRAEYNIELQRQIELEVDDVVTSRFTHAGGDA